MMEMRGLVIALVVVVLSMLVAVEAQRFDLVHKYAHLDGAPGKSNGRGASLQHTSLLKAHDRRRLATLFTLGGSADPSVGLYYTAISLGTPPKQYHVHVDTGSNLLWLNCAPCAPNCPVSTNLPGVMLQVYDPALSSTDVVLGCSESNCLTASDGLLLPCTVSPPQACAYSILYADGSSTEGYLISDSMTFPDSPTTTASANVYFGCGTNQTGSLITPGGALDGVIGFGKGGVSVPSQLAALGKVGKTFAHCLQGDIIGGGSLVIGNITEPGITYTPQVPKQTLYNVRMQNIAVNGVNVSDPVNFAITATTYGVIFDSGSTLAYLIEPAHTQFVTAISAGAPVPAQQISDGEGGYVLCWLFVGDIATTFPTVTLFFDGGATMNLAAKNYLYATTLSSRESVWCMAWGASTAYSLFGDIVLKDQLIVHDNYNELIGWKPFNCSLPIPAV